MIPLILAILIAAPAPTGSRRHAVAVERSRHHQIRDICVDALGGQRVECGRCLRRARENGHVHDGRTPGRDAHRPGKRARQRAAYRPARGTATRFGPGDAAAARSAAGLGARVAFDGANRVTITSANASAVPSGAPSSPIVTSSQTIQGTVNRVDLTAGSAAVYIGVDQQEFRIVVPPGMKIQYRETRGNITGNGSIAQVRPGDTIIAVLDRGGALVSIADIFTGYTGTVASVAGWSMVLTNGRVVEGDKSATTVLFDGLPAALGGLHAGDMVTVRADPKTGKVRDVVALSPAAPGPASSSSPLQYAVRIDAVTDNADQAFRAGQTLHVIATGSRGAAVAFDIGDLVGGIAMPETQPGRYEGSFDVTVGTNFINAPIVVRATKGGAKAQAVAADPLTIVTTPPSVRRLRRRRARRSTTGGRVCSRRSPRLATWECGPIRCTFGWTESTSRRHPFGRRTSSHICRKTISAPVSSQ